MKYFIAIISVVFFLSSCSKDTEIISNTTTATINEYAPVNPPGWPAPVYNFSNNDVTYDKFMLGRHLFYEPMLSEDTTIACGNCHQQYFAFTNGPDHNVSHGVHDLLGKRNSPALFNLNWHTLYMWDGAVNNLEVQVLAPLANPLELNLSLSNALNRLSKSTKYKNLFKKAFGDTVVDSQRFLKAIAQFMGLLVSYNSKYDKVKRGEDNFSASEKNGYDVYKIQCQYCHVEPLFSDYSFKNKGLPINLYQDSGRYRVTGNPSDQFKFKVPSLRNLAFTVPYMHDGRFVTLDNVLTFFTTGVANTPNLDPFMAIPHTVSVQQKSDLLAFLNTLNDYKFVTDPRFKEIH